MAHICIAHNFTFDWLMVNMEMARMGNQAFRWPQTRICSVEATEYLEGRRLSLDDFYARFLPDTPRGKKHRALADVQDLAAAWFAYRESGE